MPGMNGIEAAHEIQRDPELAGSTSVIMVSALGRDQVMKGSDDAGIIGFLHKPVTASTLLEAILAGFAKGQPRPESQHEKTARETPPREMFRGIRLLLVDDVPDNLELAGEILRRRGFQVTKATNGREAVKAVMETSPPFDGVLMDVQMPIMDGREATRIIRAEPAFKDLPIIAMTASTMTEDIDHCLNSGMNDHIPKPIEVSVLLSTLVRWVHPKGGDDPSLTAPFAGKMDGGTAKVPSFPDMDVTEALRRCDGSHELYGTLVQSFTDDYGGIGGEIEKMISIKDFEGAMQAVHALRGIAGNIGAMDLFNEAGKLEQAIKENELGELAKLNQGLNETLRATLESVADLKTWLHEETGSGTLMQSVPGTKLDELELIDAIGKLIVSLQNHDLDATFLLESLEGALKHHVGTADLETLMMAVNRFESEKAIMMLNDVLSRLKGMHDKS